MTHRRSRARRGRGRDSFSSFLNVDLRSIATRNAEDGGNQIVLDEERRPTGIPSTEHRLDQSATRRSPTSQRENQRVRPSHRRLDVETNSIRRFVVFSFSFFFRRGTTRNGDSSSDDIRGLVSLGDSTVELNELARDYQQRKQILRVFIKALRPAEEQQLIKHLHVVCDGLSLPSSVTHSFLSSFAGCRRSPIVGIRYKCLECPDYDLCPRCADEQFIHSHHVFAQIRRADQVRLSPSLPSAPRVSVRCRFRSTW